MKGQWIGRTTGDIEGRIIINIDDLKKNYVGEVYFWPDSNEEPVAAGFFRTEDKSNKNKFTTLIHPVDRITGYPIKEEDLKKIYPSINNYSREAYTTVNFKENELHLKARTDIGTKIESKITGKTFISSSVVRGDTVFWEDYKIFVSKLLEKKYLFRGQREPWKLRTTYHRKGRYNLTRFRDEDIIKLYRHLCGRTSHIFDFNKPDEFGAFLNLVQHHGYPTPLLDWTYSPYVAAFFAFRRVPKNEKSKGSARIYIFNAEKWLEHWIQLLWLNTPQLHLSIMEFLSIENERLIPQQSVTTVTNIDNIESYIQEKEAEKGCSYLTAKDIPYSERDRVMQELAFMGITAGSMFPGLDGACEELREKMFDE